MGRWRDRADGGQRRKEQGDDVHSPLESPDVSESGVERDDQQERKQHLHTGDDDAQLARQLLQIPVYPLQRRLAASLRRCQSAERVPSALIGPDYPLARARNRARDGSPKRRTPPPGGYLPTGASCDAPWQ